MLWNNPVGHLVVDYIANDGTLEDYIGGLSATVNNYNGYNLLMGDFGCDNNNNLCNKLQWNFLFWKIC